MAPAGETIPPGALGGIVLFFCLPLKQYNLHFKKYRIHPFHDLTGAGHMAAELFEVLLIFQIPFIY